MSRVMTPLQSEGPMEFRTAFDSLRVASEQLLTCSTRLLLWSKEARASLSRLSCGTSGGGPAPSATSATTEPEQSATSCTNCESKG